MWFSCREVQCEALGFCVPWGNRVSGTACRVAGYSFPPLTGESGILSLWWGSKGSLAVRDGGECWASMLCVDESPLEPKNSKAWSLRFTWVCGGRLLALNSMLKVPVGQQSWWA
jgi:hypothetical protein